MVTAPARLYESILNPQALLIRASFPHLRLIHSPIFTRVRRIGTGFPVVNQRWLLHAWIPGFRVVDAQRENQYGKQGRAGCRSRFVFQWFLWHLSRREAPQSDGCPTPSWGVSSSVTMVLPPNYRPTSHPARPSWLHPCRIRDLTPRIPPFPFLSVSSSKFSALRFIAARFFCLVCPDAGFHITRWSLSHKTGESAPTWTRT